MVQSDVDNTQNSVQFENQYCTAVQKFVVCVYCSEHHQNKHLSECVCGGGGGGGGRAVDERECGYPKATDLSYKQGKTERLGPYA